MTRTVFYGFGAFVGTISGPTTCAFWPDDPQRLGWSGTAMIPVDLANNPTAARAGTIAIDDIQVDDHDIDGGLTGIGPRFPFGRHVGPCWLSETYWRSLANPPSRQVASAPDEAHDYELTSLLYWDGPLKGRRFYGFHAKILGTSGPLSRVQIWNAGSSRVAGKPAAGVWWLDLAQSAHPPEPDATQISAAQPDGAVFLDADTTRSLKLFKPKLPSGMGSELYPDVVP